MIAWAARTGLRATGRYLDRYGFQPELEAVTEGKAVVWANEGTQADLRKARAYAATCDAHQEVRVGEAVVYTFPVSEPDPLGKAKARRLKEVGCG